MFDQFNRSSNQLSLISTQNMINTAATPPDSYQFSCDEDDKTSMQQFDSEPLPDNIECRNEYEKAQSILSGFDQKISQTNAWEFQASDTAADQGYAEQKVTTGVPDFKGVWDAHVQQVTAAAQNAQTGNYFGVPVTYVVPTGQNVGELAFQGFLNPFQKYSVPVAYPGQPEEENGYVQNDGMQTQRYPGGYGLNSQVVDGSFQELWHDGNNQQEMKNNGQYYY